MALMIREKCETFVVAERFPGNAFVFTSQWELLRIRGVAIRAEGATRVQFVIGTDFDRRNPNGQQLPISPFLAAHDVMRRTGAFPEKGNFCFKPITPGMSVTAIIPDAPTHAEVIFWGDIHESW